MWQQKLHWNNANAIVTYNWRLIELFWDITEKNKSHDEVL